MKTSNVHFYMNHMKTLSYLGNIDESEANDLYKKLLRIEHKENKRQVNDCNGDLHETEEEKEAHDTKVLNTLKSLLPNAEGIFINGDPRGYTLKIKENKVKELNEKGKINIYTDWGGYGILAPEF